jgi:hypothetical protein
MVGTDISDPGGWKADIGGLHQGRYSRITTSLLLFCSFPQSYPYDSTAASFHSFPALWFPALLQRLPFNAFNLSACNLRQCIIMQHAADFSSRLIRSAFTRNMTNLGSVWRDEEGCDGVLVGEALSRKQTTCHAEVIRQPIRSVSRISFFSIFCSLTATEAMYFAFPFPTTIPLYVGILVFVTTWTTSSCIAVLFRAFTNTAAGDYKQRFNESLSRSKRICLALGLAMSLLCSLHLRVPEISLPYLVAADTGVPERYFIAANLHNNGNVLPIWSREVLNLASHCEWCRTILT